MTKLSRFFTIVVMGIVLAATIWYLWPAQNPSQRAGRGRNRQEGPVPVIVADAKLADVPIYIDGVGTTKALNTVTVRPQVDGKLISILFQEGQDVPRGFLLAKIDPTTYQALYDQAIAKKAQDEAQLANAKVDLDRYVKLAASKAATTQQADTQRATVAQQTALVEADQAAIDNAKAVLDYTGIKAPIAGRTGLRMVDEGNIVHASDTTGIVVLTQLQPLAVLFNLPQQQLSQVNDAFAKGKLQVLVTGADNRTVIDRGTLTVINNQIDPTTGTVQLKGEVPNAGLQLWPGQFVNTRLLVDTLMQVVVVPTSAVQRGPDGTFVYMAKPDNTAALQNVKVSQQDETQAVIASGLKTGDGVVTTGFARLSNGAKIAVSPGAGGAEPETSSSTPATSPADTTNSQKQGDRQGRRRQRSEASTGSTP